MFFCFYIGKSYRYWFLTRESLSEEIRLLYRHYLVRVGVPKNEFWISVDREGLVKLTLLGHNWTNLNILKGIPLVELKISKTSVTDLTPLSQCTILRDLTLDNLKISDLSPIRYLPLEYLRITGTDIHDLSPITNMPLRVLLLTNTIITNLEVIAQTDITHLAFSPTKYPQEQIEKLRSSKIEVFNGCYDRERFWRFFDAGVWSGQYTINEIKQILDELGEDYSPRFPQRFEED